MSRKVVAWSRYRGRYPRLVVLGILMQLLSLPSWAKQSVTIPEFQLEIGDSMLTMHSRQLKLREREGKHNRYHQVQEEGFVRFVLREEAKEGEQQRWQVKYLENYKGVGQSFNMKYENRRLMGSSASIVLKNQQWQVTEEEPGDEIFDGYTDDERTRLIGVVSEESFYQTLSSIISSQRYKLGQTVELDRESANKFGDDASIRLVNLTEKWGKPVAEFIIEVKALQGKEPISPCHYHLTALADDGRITDVSFSCDMTLATEPNWVTGLIVERLSFSYGRRSISEFSPEPVLSVHPQGDVTSIQYMPETNVLAYLSKGKNGGNSSWLTFWDLTQRKALYSALASGDQLTLSQDGNTLAVIDENRIIENYVPIVGRFFPFGQLADFDTYKSLKSVSAFGRYTLALNSQNEIELFNTGYNRKIPLHELAKPASQLAATNDGRTLTISNDGQVNLFKLDVNHENCSGEQDFTKSWCSKPEVTFEPVIEGLELGQLFPSEAEKSTALDHLELHPELPKAIYCSSELERCGLLDYVEKTVVEFDTEALSFSRDLTHLVSRKGLFDYQGKWVFSYENSWSLMDSKAQALNEDKGVLFAGGEKIIGNRIDPVIELIDSEEGVLLDQVQAQVEPISNAFNYQSALYLVSHDVIGQKTTLKEVNLSTLEVNITTLPFLAENISINDNQMLIQTPELSIISSLDGSFAPVQIAERMTGYQWVDDGFLYLSEDNGLYRYSLQEQVKQKIHQFEETVYELLALGSDGGELVARVGGGRLILPHNARELSVGYSNAPRTSLIRTKNGFISTGLTDTEGFYNPSIPLISHFDPLGEKIDTFEASWGMPTAQFISASNRLWLGDESGGITIRSIDSGTIIESFKAHNGQVIAILQLSNGLIATASDLGEIKFWQDDKVGLLPIHNKLTTSFPLLENDIANRNGKLVLTMVVDKAGEIVLSTPEGYYWGTPKGIHAASFVNKKQLFDYRRYDLWLNRPDLILERLGFFNDTQVEQWRTIVHARQQRMSGFDPEFSFKDTSGYQFSVKGDSGFKQQAQVTLDWSTQNPFEGQIHVLVNETPLFGLKGKRVTTSVSGQVSVELSSGLNTIRMYGIDPQGNQTRSQTLSYFRAPPTKKPQLFVVTVGVSSYQYQDLNLNYARKDAEDIQELFEHSVAFSKVQHLSLHDESVTKESMVKVKEFVSRASANDRLVVFFAGHGFLDSQETYFFGSHDINPESPEERGISYDTISDIISNSPSRYKLLMLDTCHSGEVNQFASVNTASLKEGVVGRGFNVKARKPTKQDALKDSYQRLQTSFVDLRRTTGAVVISASGGYEFALEKSSIGNGVFTSAVLKGLADKAADFDQDGTVTTSELRQYTYNEVQRLTAGQQQPTTRSYNLDTDFSLY